MTVVEELTGEKSTSRVKSAQHGTGKRWRARYVDEAGRERSSGFVRKIDAQKWLEGVTTELGTGMWVDPDRSSVSFGAIAEQWFTTKAVRKPKTVAGYRSLLDTVVLPRWESIALRDIEFEDVQKWVSELTSSGSYRFEGRGLSGSRVIQAYQVAHQVLRYGVKTKRLAFNPADGVDLPRRARGERRYLSHAQVHELAVLCGRFHVLVLTLAYTGLRFGEAIALRTGDIDLNRRRITVRRSVTRVSGLGTVEGSTKNHSERSVPLPPFLADYLRVYLVERTPGDLVFPGRQGGFLPIGELRWIFDRAATEAGLTGVVPHELRHTAASLAISAGANVKVVQQMLGHKTATLTLDLYGHLLPDDLDAVADALGRAAESVVTGRAQAANYPIELSRD